MFIVNHEESGGCRGILREMLYYGLKEGYRKVILLLRYMTWPETPVRGDGCTRSRSSKACGNTAIHSFIVYNFISEDYSSFTLNLEGRALLSSS